MSGNTYGYVRVSTQEQNEARQLAAMRSFGVAEENITVEKLSGKDFRRPRYRRLVVLRFFDGLSYEEIAARLDLPLGTVKTQIHRARGRMCRMIKNEE